MSERRPVDQILVSYSRDSRVDYDAQGNVAQRYVSDNSGHFDIFDHGTNQYIRIPVSNVRHSEASETARELETRLNDKFYPEIGMIESSVNYVDSLIGGNHSYLKYGMHDPTDAIDESLFVIRSLHSGVIIQNDIRYGGVMHPSMMLSPDLDYPERYETRFVTNFAEAVPNDPERPYIPSNMEDYGELDASYFAERPEIHIISSDVSSDGIGYITYQGSEELLTIPVPGLTNDQADRVSTLLNNETMLSREFIRAVTNVSDDHMISAEETNAILNATNPLLRRASVDPNMSPAPAHSAPPTVTGAPSLDRAQSAYELVRLLMIP